MKEIENIFSFKKIKQQTCPNPNNPIYIDTREKNSLIISNLYQKKANIKIQKLEIGDYLIGDLTIERKTVSDLINSLVSYRLKEQIKNLKQKQKKAIILEKNKNEKQYSLINQKALNGIILSLTTHHQIPIIYSESEEHTSQILIQISRKQKKEQSTNTKKIPKELNQQKKFVLESFPGIGAKKSKELLEKFTSLKEIFNAEKQKIEQLTNKKTAEEFEKILNT